AAGGLAVTASHNPIEWNALKFIGPDGMFLDAEQGGRMRQLLEGEIPRASWSDLGGYESDAGAIERHLDRIFAIPFHDVEPVRARRFTIARDWVPGAGGTNFPLSLERLGCAAGALSLGTDGRVPREPEPVAAKLGELEELVRRTGADVGFA